MKSSTFNKVTITSLLLLSLSAVQADGTQQGDQFSGNVSGYLGQKSLDDKGWSELDEQGSLGVISDFKKGSWPVSIAIDLIVSGNIEEAGSLEELGGTLETHFGVRKIFKLSNSSIQPYIGGGLAIIGASIKNKNNGSITSESDDTSTGAYAGAGMYYSMSEHLNLGFDVRYSQADVTIFDVERKAGGLHSGITIGYHW